MTLPVLTRKAADAAQCREAYGGSAHVFALFPRNDENSGPPRPPLSLYPGCNFPIQATMPAYTTRSMSRGIPAYSASRIRIIIGLILFHLAYFCSPCAFPSHRKNKMPASTKTHGISVLCSTINGKNSDNEHAG